MAPDLQLPIAWNRLLRPVRVVQGYPIMGMMVSSRESVAWPDRRDERREAGTKPIDFTYLGRFTFGNRELEREVLYLFAQHAPMYLANLKSAETSKAWHDAAHTLKGSARAVGAWRVARSAELAEKICFEGESDRKSFAADHATEAVEEAITYIVQQFPET